MHKRVIVESQRRIANAFGLRGLQLLKHPAISSAFRSAISGLVLSILGAEQWRRAGIIASLLAAAALVAVQTWVVRQTASTASPHYAALLKGLVQPTDPM